MSVRRARSARPTRRPGGCLSCAAEPTAPAAVVGWLAPFMTRRPPHRWRESRGAIPEHWPSPWQDATVESLASRRLAIVGNAAHVSTLMTGSGFAASVADPSALIRALHGVDTADVLAAPEDYEGERLRVAPGLLLSSRSSSRKLPSVDPAPIPHRDERSRHDVRRVRERPARRRQRRQPPDRRPRRRPHPSGQGPRTEQQEGVES